jgi:DNA-binding HxlR family transcriptional regulator
MQGSSDYCSYTKAVEHLGDRWSLLILREIGLHGSRGFNAIVDALPGISRSVLTRRLRKLEDLGLIARQPSERRRAGPYQMAPAGEQLAPTLLSLAAWAEQWVPLDPAMAQHDPDVIVFWLKLRVDTRHQPDPPAVLAFTSTGAQPGQAWLVLEDGTEPSLCVEDPMLDEDRYLYFEGDPSSLYSVARGQRDWTEALADRSVHVYGDPALIRELPGWFFPATAA